MVRFAPETDTTSGCVGARCGWQISPDEDLPERPASDDTKRVPGRHSQPKRSPEWPVPEGTASGQGGSLQGRRLGQGASSGSSSQPIPGSPNFVCLGGSSCSSSPSTGTSQSQAPTSTTTRPQADYQGQRSNHGQTTTTTPTTAKTTAQSKPDQQSSQSVQPVLPHSARPSSTPSPSSTSSGTKICKATGEPPPPGDKCPSSGQG